MRGEEAPRYLSHLIGRLGWLDTPLPLWLLVVYALALVLFASIDGMAIPVPWRLAVAIAVAANLVLISLSQYLTWTPVDADFIHGLQGRYLIPIAPFALLLLSNQTLTGRAISRFAAPLAITISAVALATTALVLVQRYFVD